MVSDRDSESRQETPIADRTGIIREIDRQVNRSGGNGNFLPVLIMLLLMNRGPWQNRCRSWERYFF